MAVISNAGFECSTVLDKLYGLDPARALRRRRRRRLAACLPGIAHADNPVDATPMATTRQFVAAAEAMLEDDGVDALLVSPIPVTPALDNLSPDLAGGTHRENIHSPGSLPSELLAPLPEDGEADRGLGRLGAPLRRLRPGAPARRDPGLAEDRPRLAGALGARDALTGRPERKRGTGEASSRGPSRSSLREARPQRP